MFFFLRSQIAVQSRLWCKWWKWSKLTKSHNESCDALWTGSRRQAFEEDGGSAALSGVAVRYHLTVGRIFSMSGKNHHSEWSSYHEISYPSEWVEKIWNRNISQVMTDRNFSSAIAIASPSSIADKPTSTSQQAPPNRMSRPRSFKVCERRVVWASL